MGIVKTSLPRRGDFSLCKKYLPFFVTPNEVRGARLSLGRTKRMLGMTKRMLWHGKKGRGGSGRQGKRRSA